MANFSYNQAAPAGHPPAAAPWGTPATSTAATGQQAAGTASLFFFMSQSLMSPLASNQGSAAHAFQMLSAAANVLVAAATPASAPAAAHAVASPGILLLFLPLSF
jgi:hypothetical protein